MEISDVISLITNIGFPVTLCFILIYYMLQTIGERFDQLDQSLNQLLQGVQLINNNKEE